MASRYDTGTPQPGLGPDLDQVGLDDRILGLGQLGGGEQPLRCILVAGQGARGNSLDPAAVSRQEDHVAISQPVGHNHLSGRVHKHRFAAGNLLRDAA